MVETEVVIRHVVIVMFLMRKFAEMNSVISGISLSVALSERKNENKLTPGKEAREGKRLIFFILQELKNNRVLNKDASNIHVHSHCTQKCSNS